MAVRPSNMLPLGTSAPAFVLPDAADNGKNKFLSEISRGAKGTLVVFVANHCPYVKHIIRKLAEVTKEFRPQGLASVWISSSFVDSYPEDSPLKMADAARNLSIDWPYLYDEDQETAKAFLAACTPDIYLFDSDLKLAYRGQFDSSRPGNAIPVTGDLLHSAIRSVLDGKPVEVDQTPATGCSIKWKPGNEPEYF